MFKSYKEYKPSNMTWTKLLPINWEEKRISTFFCYKNDNIGNKWTKTQLLSLTKNGIIKKDINSGKGKSHSDYSTYQKIEKNDFIFCLFDIDETPRTVGLSTLEGMITSAYTSFTPKKNINNRFIYYLFEYIDDEKALKPFYSGMRKTIKTSDFLKIKIQFPPKFEQNQIANFLDQETQKIDDLIAKQEKLIELLEEQRKSIISYAVTKGVNPNAKMKVSGVEWLGEVPEHWTVTAVKRLLEIPITDGPHETPEFVDDGIPFISAEAIFNSKIDFDKKRGFITSAANELYSKKYSPKLNDIYMVKSGATTGKVAIVETEEIFNIWSPLAVFRCQNEKINYKFLFYFFRSSQFYKALCLNWSYGTQQNIGMKTLGNIQVAFPSQTEQIEVVNHIEKENIKLNLLIQKEISLVEKLKEYRASIICHAVTGQIDVRDLVE